MLILKPMLMRTIKVVDWQFEKIISIRQLLLSVLMRFMKIPISYFDVLERRGGFAQSLSLTFWKSLVT